MADASDIQIVRGGRLLDVPGHAADHADILIDGGRISEIGPAGMEAPGDARVIDATGKLLMPGLVNAHTHGHGSLAKGIGDRWSLELLLNAGPWIGGARTLEDKHLAARVNAAEMVRKGCTAAYDLYAEIPAPTSEGIEAVARAYAEVGIRAVIAPMMADRLLFDAIPGLREAIPESLRGRLDAQRATPHATSIAVCRDLLRRWPFDRSTINLAIAPTIPLHCSDEFLAACRDLAREYGAGVHMHLAESKAQSVSGITRYGRTLVAHLDDLGLLGPGFTGAHCVWLDDDDIRRLADSGASVAHNPGSNLRLGSGIAPVRAMLDRGLNVGIGTDGSNCSDNQNMFEAMRIASFASRLCAPDPATWLATDEVVTLATEGSARALGFGDDIGRVAPGFRADMVLLDLDSINYVPLNDPTNQIVHCEDSSAVDSVMIGGRMVLENGRFTTIDYAALRRDVETAVDRLRAATADMRDLSARLEEFVGLYCVGLSRKPYHVHRTLG